MLRFLSLLGVTAVMVMSALYALRTYQRGETRWYFLILAICIAMLLAFNVMGKRKR